MLFLANISSSLGFLITFYTINTLLILIVIFVERKSPASTLAWIMVISFVPILGFVFYFILNQNISRNKLNKRSNFEQMVVSNALERQLKDMDNDDYCFNCQATSKWKNLIKLNQVYGKAYYTENNRVEIFTDGNALMKALKDDILDAKESINLEYFIIKNDYTGRELISLLTQKAKEGVQVRLLVDSLGSRGINSVVLKDFIRAGGKIGFFFKPYLKIFGLKLNYRNHRKIVIIDGRLAYTGGFNIGKEYIGEKKKFGYWRDTHIRIKGDSVADLNQRFILDWRFTTKEKIEYIPTSLKYKEKPGNVGMQIVSCGPDSPSQEVKRGFMKMITNAQKSVYIQTPYFVPDGSIIESLKMAAQSGVDVRVMIPQMPDHMFVYWATYSYVGELLRSGAKAYIYKNGFLHAKTLVVDGEVATVGSTNFDNRSFKLNFETNAFIFDQNMAGKILDIFQMDMENCKELTYQMYKERGNFIKFKEAISRLLSDIL